MTAVHRVGSRLVSIGLRYSGLAEVPAPSIPPAIRADIDQLLLAARASTAGPVPALASAHSATTVLGHLASRDDVLFHGTARGGLDLLRTERESGDSREFGRQSAVFASDDPWWAAFFALVDRGNARSIRNGSLASTRTPLDRRYFLSVEPRDPGRPLLKDGFVYVVDRAGFRAEPPLRGMLETAQWVSPEAVRPLAVVALTPAEYPLAPIVREHRAGERSITTMWRSRLRLRAQT